MVADLLQMVESLLPIEATLNQIEASVATIKNGGQGLNAITP